MQNWLHGYPCYCENNYVVFCKHSCKHQFLETGLFASLDIEMLNDLSNFLSEVETQTCPCENHIDDYSNEHILESPLFVTYRNFTRKYKALFKQIDLEDVNKQYSKTLEAWIYAKLHGYMNPWFVPIMFSEFAGRDMDEATTFEPKEEDCLINAIHESSLIPNISLAYGRLVLLKQNYCPCKIPSTGESEFLQKISITRTRSS